MSRPERKWSESLRFFASWWWGMLPLFVAGLMAGLIVFDIHTHQPVTNEIFLVTPILANIGGFIVWRTLRPRILANADELERQGL